MEQQQCVCVGRQGSLALAGSLSRRRKTLIQNRGLWSPLASSGTSATLSMWQPYSPIISDLPSIGFWVCFVGDVGRWGTTFSHVKNLTAQTWRSTRGWSLGIDPTAAHSSFIEVPSTGLQVCVCVCVCVRACACVCVCSWLASASNCRRATPTPPSQPHANSSATLRTSSTAAPPSHTW